MGCGAQHNDDPDRYVTVIFPHISSSPIIVCLKIRRKQE
jgi:hypothetical protein